ncbi:MAG: drug resistance transporter, EmrB/QacA subfamily [Conexibacter sp.]|nr:drug resistance transporter, EmrB/QacA subfamily [Conexibacter sp.]
MILMPETAIAPTASPDATAGADRRRWIALIVVCLAMLMNTLDASIVNVALPSIQRDLNFSQANLTWVVDAYLIALGSFLLLAGRLGDLVGRKRVFLAGILLFTLASAWCGLSTGRTELIVARFVQGMGGAISSSVIIAIIAIEFPRPVERARAMSAYIFVAVGGGSLGLLAGGVLTQSINWHWIFFVNLPIGAAVLVAGWRLIDQDEGIGIRQGVDVLGSVLITVALMVGIYAIVTSSQHGWGSAHTLGFGAVAVALVAAFFVLQSRLRNPIMPLRILRLPGLISSSLVRSLLASAMWAVFFLGALYLEKVRGFSPLEIGLGFLPMTGVVAILSTGITARLMGRFGPFRVLVPGIAAAVIGLLVLSRVSEHSGYFPTFFIGLVVMGFGMGTSFMPLLTIAMADVPRSDAGLGSGIVNVSQQLSGALGLAVFSTIATSHARSLSADGHTPIAALTGGYHVAFLAAAGCAAFGGVTALALLRPRARAAEPAEPEAVTADV